VVRRELQKQKNPDVAQMMQALRDFLGENLARLLAQFGDQLNILREHVAAESAGLS